MIEQYRVRDVTFPSIQDVKDRRYIGYGLNDAAIGSTYLAEQCGRIARIAMQGSDGTTTIEIKINGVPQFVSGQPSVEGRGYDNPSGYLYQRGDVIQVAVVSGTATGRAVMDLEAHELIKRDDVVATPARQRLTREAERHSYDAQPDKLHKLQERWGSFAEAAAQQASRALATTSGEIRERGGIASGGTGDSVGGGGSRPGPTDGLHGKPSHGGKIR